MPAPNPVRELIKRALEDYAPFGSYQERYELFDPFHVAVADSNFWTVGGTNAGSGAAATNHAGGGIVLTTGDTDDDQRILSPANALTTTRWDPQYETRFEALLDLGTVANVLVKAGLALTSAMDRTTDDDQAAFVFDTEGGVSAANWTAIESVDGDDDETDTEREAEADGTIRLGIRISSTGVPRYYVNGIKVHTGNELTAAAVLKPFIGIQTLSAANASLRVRGVRISRVLA